MWELTDASVALSEVFGADGALLEDAMRAATNDEEQIAVVERFLGERLPERDENVAVVNRVVDRIAAEQAITKVDAVVERLGMSKRTLQRLFRRYVGVGPKWVIQRYRLQEAADCLTDGESVDWTRMALDLGYYDQAHFIKDFKASVGMSPAEYAESVGLDA